MHGLETDVAFLPLRVVRTRLDRDRDGLLVFVVGVVLLRVAAAVNLLADLLVAAAPVVMLACRVAISRFAPHTSRGVVGQWGGAGGAGCEEHCVFAVDGLAFGRRQFLVCELEKPVTVLSYPRYRYRYGLHGRDKTGYR